MNIWVFYVVATRAPGAARGLAGFDERRDLGPVLPKALRLVQRAVSDPEELLAGQDPGFDRGDADRHGAEPAGLVGCGEQAEQAASDLRRGAEVGLRDERDELVAAVATDEVRRAQLPTQACRDFEEKVIARVVAELVIHSFECVAVDEKKREWALVAHRADDLRVEPRLQRACIGKPGQLIGERKVCDL